MCVHVHAETGLCFFILITVDEPGEEMMRICPKKCRVFYPRDMGWLSFLSHPLANLDPVFGYIVMMFYVIDSNLI